MDPNYWFESHIKSENNQIIETQNKTDAHREGGCPFLTQEKFSHIHIRQGFQHLARVGNTLASETGATRG